MKNVARARMERAAWVLVLGRGGCSLVEDGWVVIVHFVVIHIMCTIVFIDISLRHCVCVGHVVWASNAFSQTGWHQKIKLHT